VNLLARRSSRPSPGQGSGSTRVFSAGHQLLGARAPAAECGDRLAARACGPCSRPAAQLRRLLRARPLLYKKRRRDQRSPILSPQRSPPGDAGRVRGMLGPRGAWPRPDRYPRRSSTFTTGPTISSPRWWPSSSRNTVFASTTDVLDSNEILETKLLTGHYQLRPGWCRRAPFSSARSRPTSTRSSTSPCCRISKTSIRTWHAPRRVRSGQPVQRRLHVDHLGGGL